MQIAAITDLHGRVGSLETLSGELARADLVLVTGDLTHFGRREDGERVVGALREINERLLCVAGNCDHPEVARYLEEEGISLHARHEVVEGIAFLGVGGSLPAPAGTPNEFSEAQLADFLARAAAGAPPDVPWVLAAHQPPHDTATDRVRSGRHVGSVSVRNFIEQNGPLVCFTGHIHESRGTDELGRTRVINPGPAARGNYALAELDDGLALLEIRVAG
jgi:Icc-related predicted phosphoesterase